MTPSEGNKEDRSESKMDTSGPPASGFTAVNGKVSPPGQAKPKSEQEKKSPQEASNHRQLLPNNHESAPPAQRDGGRPMAAMHERRLSPAPSNNSEQRPVTNGHSQHPEGYGNGNPQQPPPPHVMMSPPVPRRKRSLSQERAPPYPGNGPPQSPGGHRMSIDGGNMRERDPYAPRHPYSPPHEHYGTPHDPYPPPPAHHSYPPPPQEHNGPGPHDIYPRSERHPGARMEYDHPVDPSIAPGGPPRPYYQDPHDAQLADALQRENRGYGDGPPNRDTFHSPEDDDDQNGQYDDYGGGRDSQSMEADRRKRKRIFSNRTKTGCMTCRRRKKKCDELHPECQNCLRGGFVCEGYNARHNWQKPASAKPPIPLQSKNGYPVPPGPPGRPPYPPPPRYDTAPEYPAPAPSHHRGSYDGGRPGPPSEEERDPYGRPEAQPKPQPAWNKAARPYPSNPPQASKYDGGYEHRGSVYEGAPDAPDPHSSHPPPSSRRESTVSQYPPPHNGTPGPPRDPQAAAQAALTHPASLRSTTSSRQPDPMPERDKMLKGLYYHPTTPILVQDRENCIAAIWRFNNATNPSHGVSPEERIRLFRQILALRPTPEPPGPNGESPPPSDFNPAGSCGENCIVEAPFTCEYGYNITVGNNVLISSDCRISDTCQVQIGSRCIFSPNVKLICSTYPIDPRRRQGAQGAALSRNIVIEEDCWIGANVTILAGVRIGRSSTIGAGSLVHTDVPRFTVVAGNPAKVSRGIYDGGNEP